VTLPDRQGRTPLALAQARGYDAMVRLLHQAGARAGGGQGGAPCGEVVTTLTTHDQEEAVVLRIARFVRGERY
jgi:hypothetical protein